MTEYVKKNGKTYVIETGYGFDMDNSEVRCYNGVDKFGRLIDGEFIFRGTWKECIEFVENL